MVRSTAEDIVALALLETIGSNEMAFMGICVDPYQITMSVGIFHCLLRWFVSEMASGNTWI